MKVFNNKFVVYSSLEKVWAFYTNIRHLEKITPPQMNLRILHTTSEEIEEGSETWITGKIIFNMKWHSRIVTLERYRYVDEMFVSGSEKPFFKSWRHEHIFKAGEGQTIVLDLIKLELPFGPAGRIFEGFAIKRLRNLFKYREAATRKQLE
jgi:ligand-binding SRPBCC domain-containing protein